MDTMFMQKYFYKLKNNNFLKVISVKKDEIEKFNGDKLKVCETVFGDSTGIVNGRIVGSI